MRSPTYQSLISQELHTRVKALSSFETFKCKSLLTVTNVKVCMYKVTCLVKSFPLLEEKEQV